MKKGRAKQAGDNDQRVEKNAEQRVDAEPRTEQVLLMTQSGEHARWVVDNSESP